MTLRALLAALWFAVASAVAAQESPAPAALDAVPVVGQPRGPKLTGAALEAMTSDVSSRLRCPVCQGLSAEASPTGTARAMRAQVKQMLGDGFDEEQIFRFFESSFGESVRLDPPLRGINWFVWLTPAIALLGGAFLVRRAMTRLAARPPAIAAQAEQAIDRDRLPDDPELARAVLRVREAAWGWPGGRSPVTPSPSTGEP